MLCIEIDISLEPGKDLLGKIRNQALYAKKRIIRQEEDNKIFQR